MKKIFLSLLLTVLLANFCLAPSVKATETNPTTTTLDNYLAYFYNRSATHFDTRGWYYQWPGYGYADWTEAKSAREILSIATFYKYRALAGDSEARQIIREAIFRAQADIDSRPDSTFGFSDAWAEMTILSLDNQLNLLNFYELWPIQYKIIQRAEAGLAFPDDSNREALLAVYWQGIINQLVDRQALTLSQRQRFNQLIRQRIDHSLKNDVDKYGWYWEDGLKQTNFSIHYHVVMATALMAYGDMVNNQKILAVAKKMTVNLRALSFKNGMVEAKLGNRPVGLGAQFYLGVGLLNYYFGFKDYATYFNYSAGNRFFSDKQYPDRLEYHSTISKTAPQFHDDTAFSNLAELALLIPKFNQLTFSLKFTSLTGYPVKLTSGKMKINNTGASLRFNKLLIKQLANGIETSITK